MAETSVDGAIHRKPSGKRVNRTERTLPPPPPSSPRDLFSALPDEAIHLIFSFLPLRDVVRTSVLSNRWRSTWISTTDLVFDGMSTIDEGLDSSLVDSALLQSTSPTVKRFHVIDFKCDEANSPKLDSWLRFAEERRVEDLCLRLTMPRFLCRLSWLVRLEVIKCCFPLGTTINIGWPCLKYLLLQFSESSEDVVEEIVSGSPVLKSLQLHMCSGVKNIRIDSTSVKGLVLIQSDILKTEKIWAPHLLSPAVFWIWFHDPYVSSLVLEDVSSLVEAKLYFKSNHMKLPGRFLKGLLEKLRGVTRIATAGLCLRVPARYFWRTRVECGP